MFTVNRSDVGLLMMVAAGRDEKGFGDWLEVGPDLLDELSNVEAAWAGDEPSAAHALVQTFEAVRNDIERRMWNQKIRERRTRRRAEQLT